MQAVVDLVKDLLPDGVVSARKVVGSVLLPVQQELGVEHLRERAGADVIDHRRLKVDRDLAGDVLPGASLLEERREVLIHIIRALAILPDFMFRSVLSPNCIAQLDAGLSNRNRKNFAGRHDERCLSVFKQKSSASWLR